jgi:hypothetical protein
VRYLTFAGKKGWLPGWIARLWVRTGDMPLRLGKINGAQKWVWVPDENRLSIVNTVRDPFELRPEILADDQARYEEATSELKQWFLVTNKGGAAGVKSEQDEKVLESLGYTQ